MANLAYEFTPSEAIAIDECLSYLKKFQNENVTIRENAEYTPAEIEAILQTMTRQHSRIELMQTMRADS